MIVFDKFAGYPAGFVSPPTPIARCGVSRWRWDCRSIFIHWNCCAAGATSAPLPSRCRARRQRRTGAGQRAARRRRQLSKVSRAALASGDGGRYIGTQDMVIVRDPEQGWVNMGCYRAMSAAPRSSQSVDQSAKAWPHSAQKYWRDWQGRAGRPVVFGCEPVTWMTASMSPPFRHV
jgi:hypothetical protein